MENKTPDIKTKESVSEETLKYENLIDPGNEHHHHAEDEPGNSPDADAATEENKTATDNKPE